uniref:Uncharacterized protein n=1 Tax=Fagus sylvatica TaxID=28930 RepID=A0A2N9HA23_FAGSY
MVGGLKKEMGEIGAVSDLKKSFHLALRPLLTACSNQELCKAFPMFSNAEQQHLHRLFLQVLTSLHENIEDEFQSLCLQTQIGIKMGVLFRAFWATRIAFSREVERGMEVKLSA